MNAIQILVKAKLLKFDDADFSYKRSRMAFVEFVTEQITDQYKLKEKEKREVEFEIIRQLVMKIV